MLKIAVLLLVAFVLFRWAIGYWPWQLASGPDSSAREVAKARRLLGVSARADRTEVLAAHRLALTRAHPDRGGSERQVHAIDMARDRLLADMGEPPARPPARDPGLEEDTGAAGDDRDAER